MHLQIDIDQSNNFNNNQWTIIIYLSYTNIVLSYNYHFSVGNIFGIFVNVCILLLMLP